MLLQSSPCLCRCLIGPLGVQIRGVQTNDNTSTSGANACIAKAMYLEQSGTYGTTDLKP